MDENKCVFYLFHFDVIVPLYFLSPEQFSPATEERNMVKHHVTILKMWVELLTVLAWVQVSPATFTQLSCTGATAQPHLNINAAVTIAVKQI